MRTPKKILLVLGLLICSLSVPAQVILTVDTIFGLPDTAIEGQTYFPTTLVRNAGSTPYQGTLQIGIQSTNPVFGAIGFLYFSNTPIVILANDTVQLTPPNGFVFDSTFFRPGNNVVVVWPVSQQLIQVDTVTTDVYLLTTSGLYAPESGALTLSPVPAREHLAIRSARDMRVEQVRIYDASGRGIPVESHQHSARQLDIYLGHLPAGTYILELLFADGTPVRTRFLRGL